MEEVRYYEEYEIDLREYIMLIWNNKWFILGLFMFAVLAAFVVSQYFLTPVYETESLIQLSNVGSLYSEPSYVTGIIKSNRIVEPIMKEYNRDYTEAALRSYINNNITVDNNKSIIKIKVKDSDPEFAEILSNNIIASFSKQAEEQYENYLSNQKKYIALLNNEIKTIEEDIKQTGLNIEQINQLELNPAEKGLLINSQLSRLNQLQTQKSNYIKEVEHTKEEILATYPVKIINQPYLPANPISPNTKLNLAIAGVLALMLGVFVVFFREFMKEEEN